MKLNKILRFLAIVGGVLVFCVCIWNVYGRNLSVSSSNFCSEEYKGLILCTGSKKVSIKSGESATLNLTLTNVSSRKIDIETTAGFATYKINITLEDATPLLTRTEFKRKYNLMTEKDEKDWISSLAVSHHGRALSPGDSFAESLDLTKIYDLSPIGTYSVSIGKQLIGTDGKADGYIELNNIEIDVN